MLCACVGDHFKSRDSPPSPQSLATRDFSAANLFSGNIAEVKHEEDDSSLKGVASLNYEEARALLGRLEFQRNNFAAAVEVFRGIDVKTVTSKIVRAIAVRSHIVENAPSSVISMQTANLLLEAILLKSQSLDNLNRPTEAANECVTFLDIIEAALPNGLNSGIVRSSKTEEMIHIALETLPNLWIKSGLITNAIEAYRRTLTKQWNLNANKVAQIQKRLASILLHLPHLNNTEEALLLLQVLTEKVSTKEIQWDDEITELTTYACSITGRFDLLAKHIELAPPKFETERNYSLALAYSANSQNDAALNLLSHTRSHHLPSLLLGAKLSSQNPKHSREGIHFSRRALTGDPHVASRAGFYMGVNCGHAATTCASDEERRRLHDASLNSLTLAARHADEGGEVRRALCLESLRQRNTADAVEYAVGYCERAPSRISDALMVLAYAVSGAQNLGDAESIAELALEDSGREEQIVLFRLKAAIQRARNKPKEAIDTLRNLLSVLSSYKEDEPVPLTAEEVCTWQELAELYMEVGSLQNARTCVEKAEKMELYRPGTWHVAGKYFEAQKKKKKAVACFVVSLSIEPSYVASMVSLAGIFLDSGGGGVPMARTLLVDSVRLDPTNHAAWRSLGLLAKAEGSFNQAADFFQAAYELKMSSPVPGL